MVTGNKIGFASSSFYSPNQPWGGGGGDTLGIFGWGCAARTLEPHCFEVTWQLTMKLFPLLNSSDCQWAPNLLPLSLNANFKKHTLEVSASKPVEFPVLIKAGSGAPCGGLLNKSPLKFWPPSALGCPASSMNWFGLKKNKATVLT